MPFSANRYEQMQYRRCGTSGLLLPVLSLGMWHNFGANDDPRRCADMMQCAFDLGITHFDLANNYGPPPGSAEKRVGEILHKEFGAHRDELIISTKAGYPMWAGPYGDGGSRKYLLASLDQSLQRLGLDYVDLFYSHRPDPDTPFEETLEALDQAVRMGKALYAGLSSYSAVQFTQCQGIVRTRKLAPITVHQCMYNMLTRNIEGEVLDSAAEHGTGFTVFCPLAQGLLTNKYLDKDNPIPEKSRAADKDGVLLAGQVTPEVVAKVRRLNEIAEQRGQSMAQMALAWVLRDPRITSALIGARHAGQIRDSAGVVSNLTFAAKELAEIDEILDGA